VNDTEDGIKFEDITFKELTDVPNNFTGLDKQILAIDETNNKVSTIEYKFTKLLDTPDTYLGNEKKLVSVNSDGT